MERPIGDERGIAVLKVASDRHRQHAVVARCGGHPHVMFGQRPVLVRGEVDHLMHDKVAGPGSLLTGRTIDVGVVGTGIHRAKPGQINLVKPRVARPKKCATHSRSTRLPTLQRPYVHR